MAIFSRRTVDRMLRENAAFLTEEQLDQHVARLNTKGFQSLDAEWEVAVLNACSKLGRVQHEPLLDGTSKLDLLFTTKDGSKFLADITTVSDEGLEEKEPVEAFNIELKKRLKRAGLLFVDGHSLSVRILRPTVSAPGQLSRQGTTSKPRYSIRGSKSTSRLFNSIHGKHERTLFAHPRLRSA